MPNSSLHVYDKTGEERSALKRKVSSFQGNLRNVLKGKNLDEIYFCLRTCLIADKNYQYFPFPTSIAGKMFLKLEIASGNTGIKK